MKVATIDTNKGAIRIQLYDEKAPETVANFEKLISDGYLNDGCKLCKASAIKEFSYCKIWYNDSPYDRIAKMHVNIDFKNYYNDDYYT